MNTEKKNYGVQPEALAELAKSSREKVPGNGPRELSADGEDMPIPTDNRIKHDVAEAILHSGAKGRTVNPKDVGEDDLPDRTRSKT
jgi:hypothetical protein